MAQVQQQILALLPPSLRNLLEGGTRRDLLRKVDTSLLVHGNQVVLMESRNSMEFQHASGPIDPVALASVCKTLIQSHQKDASVLLLLPPSEFVATPLTLPGVAKENLASALKLQTDSLLPAYEEEIALAINANSVEQSDSHIAIWMADSRMDAYFDAFKSQDLFLAAIKPRALTLAEPEIDTLMIDVDQESKTAILSSQGVIKKWLHVNNIDFNQQEFADQWKQIIKDTDTDRTVELDEATDFFDQTDKNNHKEYIFLPSGALTARNKTARGKKILAGGIIAVAALLLSSIPFILQSLEFRSSASRLEAQRVMSASAREDQTAVVNFENEWGPINDYPQQDVREAMFTLVSVLSPDRLTSAEFSEGLIKIQGTSVDPQALLERLEQNPMFTEVIFSRATSNSRYYIDLRIADINFEAYMVRYFPDD